MAEYPRIEVASENAFIVYCGVEVSGEMVGRVQRIDRAVREGLGSVLLDTIPSYASLLVIYQADRINGSDMRVRLELCVTEVDDPEDRIEASRLIALPVWYGTEAGADLPALAEAKGMKPEEVIALHQEREYRVYAIGFAPGFAYLGEVDKRIAAPRLHTPRQKVPCGAVGIAERQTAVYPSESPGGWNLIGRCPLQMFDLNATEPMSVKVGDRVRFEPIDRAQFLALGGEL